MTRYQLEIFEYSHYAQKSFTYVAEALTPLLRLGTFSWIVTCDSHQKNSQFPTLVAAHQADVRGPPVGRGPQGENRWTTRIWNQLLPSTRSTLLTDDSSASFRSLKTALCYLGSSHWKRL